MKILPILAACLILTPSAFARIGETLEQCTARYGKVMGKMDGKFAFKKGEIAVFVEFYKDKVAAIMFTKANDAGDELSKVEIQGLVNANGKNWQEAVAANGDQIWINGERTRTATYLKNKDILIIMDLKAREALKEQKSNEDKKKLEGF